MSRFFLPRHARTHLPGGSDPLSIPTGADVSWAIMADYQDMPTSVDTFTMASGPPYFFTNNAAVYERRSDSGSPTYDGIQILQAGIYEVTWAIEGSWSGSPASTVDAIRLGVISGASFTGTHYFQIDDGDVYNYGTSTAFVGGWNVSRSGLIGFESDSPADNYITIGWSYTGGASADIDGRGVMFIKRLGDFVEGFAAF